MLHKKSYIGGTTPSLPNSNRLASAITMGLFATGVAASALLIAALRLRDSNRLNEVSFNAVLLKELRMIALLRQAGDPGDREGAHWAGMRIHRIASEMLTELGAPPSSTQNGNSSPCCTMRGEGRRKSF